MRRRKTKGEEQQQQQEGELGRNIRGRGVAPADLLHLYTASKTFAVALDEEIFGPADYIDSDDGNYLDNDALQ